MLDVLCLILRVEFCMLNGKLSVVFHSVPTMLT